MFLIDADTDIGIELQEEKRKEDNSIVECTKITLDAKHDEFKEEKIHDNVNSTLTEVTNVNDFQESETDFNKVASDSADGDKGETDLSEKDCRENDANELSEGQDDVTEKPENEPSSKCDCDSSKPTSKRQLTAKNRGGKNSNRGGRGRQSGKHLSNRQRKELAKQERKKRREDMKKDSSVSDKEEECPSIPQDVHVISI